MNIYDKIRNFCRKFRIMLGLVLIVTGYLMGDGTVQWSWWYLGALPLIAGILDFCPICIFSNKCTPKL
jgi:hypothetical protein